MGAHTQNRLSVFSEIFWLNAGHRRAPRGGLNDMPQTVESIWRNLRLRESADSLPVHFFLHFHQKRVNNLSPSNHKLYHSICMN